MPALTAGTNGARVIHQVATAPRRTAARTAAAMRRRRGIAPILAPPRPAVAPGSRSQASWVWSTRCRFGAVRTPGLVRRILVA